MNDIDKKLVAFALGMAVGHWGLRWVYHGGYLALAVGAFFLGRHFG